MSFFGISNEFGACKRAALVFWSLFPKNTFMLVCRKCWALPKLKYSRNTHFQRNLFPETKNSFHDLLLLTYGNLNAIEHWPNWQIRSLFPISSSQINPFLSFYCSGCTPGLDNTTCVARVCCPGKFSVPSSSSHARVRAFLHTCCPYPSEQTRSVILIVEVNLRNVSLRCSKVIIPCTAASTWLLFWRVIGFCRGFRSIMLITLITAIKNSLLIEYARRECDQKLAWSELLLRATTVCPEPRTQNLLLI